MINKKVFLSATAGILFGISIISIGQFAFQEYKDKKGSYIQPREQNYTVGTRKGADLKPGKYSFECEVGLVAIRVMHPLSEEQHTYTEVSLQAETLNDEFEVELKDGDVINVFPTYGGSGAPISLHMSKD